MKKNQTIFVLLLSTICFLASCKKEAGEGGSSTIKGTLYSKNFYSPNTSITEEDFEPDEDIFLIYGEKPIYDDDFKTSYDGSFEFKYLRKGTYKIFAYSLDSNQVSPSEKMPVTRTIEITGRNEVIDIKDLVVLKEANKGGTSTIKGKVFTKDYNGNFTIINSQYYTPDEYVYIIYGNSGHYNDRIKTNIDGSYEFKNLRKGSYKIFTYSEDPTLSSPSGIISVSENTEITAKNQVIELPDLIISK